MACRNDTLARLRAHKRESLLEATEASLSKIADPMVAGKLRGQGAIGVRVGKSINRYKIAKHFELAIGAASLTWSRRPETIAAEAALDGLYIIRSSVPAAQMDAPECVRRNKSLANVERAFHSMKTIDLKVRPIHHRLADRVRAHILLCNAGLLCRMAPARGLARAGVCRYRAGLQGHARPRAARPPLAIGTDQG